MSGKRLFLQSLGIEWKQRADACSLFLAMRKLSQLAVLPAPEGGINVPSGIRAQIMPKSCNSPMPVTSWPVMATFFSVALMPRLYIMCDRMRLIVMRPITAASKGEFGRCFYALPYLFFYAR